MVDGIEVWIKSIKIDKIGDVYGVPQAKKL